MVDLWEEIWRRNLWSVTEPCGHYSDGKCGKEYKPIPILHYDGRLSVVAFSSSSRTYLIWTRSSLLLELYSREWILCTWWTSAVLKADLQRGRVLYMWKYVLKYVLKYVNLKRKVNHLTTSRVYIADSGEIKEETVKESELEENFVPPSLRSWKNSHWMACASFHLALFIRILAMSCKCIHFSQ